MALQKRKIFTTIDGVDVLDLTKSEKTEIVKHASINKSDQTDLNGFDIHTAIKENPESLFVKVFAIKENEVNDNGDYFSAEELKKAAHTFIGVPVFVNHQNSDVEKARGNVVHAWYDEKAGGIFTINRVDKKAYPQLARGIEEKYVIGTSMGAINGDALILMSDLSLKPICEIQVGEEVITPFGNKEKVLETHSKFLAKPMYEFDVGNFATMPIFTEDHPILIIDGEHVKEKKKDFKSWRTYEYVPYFIKASDIKEGDFALIPSRFKLSFEKNKDFDSDFFYLLGAFLGDGYIIYTKGKVGGFAFCLGINDKKELLSKIKSIISKYSTSNINETEIEDRNGLYINIYDRKLAEKIESLVGNGSHNKRIKINSFTKEEAQSLICGLIDTDGCMVKDYTYTLEDNRVRGFNISSCNKHMLEDVQSLLMLLDIPSYINTMHRIPSFNSVVKVNTVENTLYIGRMGCNCLKDSIKVSRFIGDYDSEFSTCRNFIFTKDGHKYLACKIKDINIIEYDKEVYDLTIDKDESYIANNIAVHNCSVSHSLCSVCHKKASSQEDFCSHVKERKNKKFSGKHECKYHDSPDKPEGPCPICGKKKGESKTLEYKEAKIFEYNYDIKFIEDSFVVNPACHDCLVCDVLTLDKITSHINHLSEQRDLLVKAASNNTIIKTSGQKQIDVINNAISKLVNIVELMKNSHVSNEESINTDDQLKTAGQKEITHINEAINRLDIVARSMMAQKNKVQLDYVSDIVEAMADIQTTLDELTQMGYAQLPSPSEQEIAFGSKDLLSSAADVSASAQTSSPQQIQPNSQGFSQQTTQPAINNNINTGVNNSFSPQSGSLGSDLGTVTKPSFSAAASISGEEFVKHANNIKDDLHKIRDVIKDFSQNNIENVNFENNLGSDKYNKICESSNGDCKVIITSRQDGEIKIAEFKDDKLIRVSNSDIFDKEIQLRLVNEPQKVADFILQQLKKESDSNMGSQEKIAANNDSSQVNVTTEAQLENSKNPIAARKDSVYEGITESKDQIGGKEQKNDTTSASPQVRKESAYETITEEQLSSVKDGFVARWADFPEVITEGQWEEINRAIGSVLPSDWNETITQKQLASLRENHSWVDPESITEKQMSEHKSDISRQASSRNPRNILKAAKSAISDAIAYYGLTPSQIQSSISRIASNPHAQIKSARMILLNSIPRVLESRKNEISRRQYFAKVASKDSSFNPMDGVICSIADNIGYLNANDIVEAMKFAATDNKFMKQAEQEAVEKMNIKTEDSNAHQNMFDLFKQTFAEMEKSDDGIYKVCGSIKDDLDFTDTNDRNRFIQSVEKFAFAQIPSEGVVTNIDIDEDYGVFEATVKEHRVLSAEEKDALNKTSSSVNKEESNGDSISRSANRKNMLKEAQMLGGQMGGGMGGGGTPPPGPAPAPAAATPPVESFTEENTDPLDESGDDGDMSSKPPGSVCPACGSEDVDVAGGKSHCNNCGLDFVVKVDIEALNWPGIIDDGQGETKEKKDTEKGLVGEGSGEGFPMPSKEEPASIPVAASTKLTRNTMLKLASMDTKIGDISPITGSKNTIRIAENEFMCLDTGHRYSVALKGGAKKDDVYAEWRWLDKSASSFDCDSCHKQKDLFVKALNSMGISESSFDLSSAIDKAKIILSMQENGLLKQIKTASKNSSVLSAFKTAYAIDKEKFPMESCIEKLARRFGENAVAISGPCEGSNLADCVCNKLKTAGFYSDKLANKVASIWSDQDGTVECWEDYIRSGLSAKQAATTCEQLRRKYSQAEHLLADELGENDNDIPSNDGSDMTDGGIDVSVEFQGDDLLNPETDPFSDVNSEKNPDISLDILEALKNLNESIISHLEKDQAEEKIENTDGSEVSTDDSTIDTIEDNSSDAVTDDSATTDISETPVIDEVSKDSVIDAPSETPAEESIDTKKEEKSDIIPETSLDNKTEEDSLPKESDSITEEIVEEKPSTEESEKDNKDNCDCPCSEEAEEDDDSQKGNFMEKEGLEDKTASAQALEDAYTLRRGKIVGTHKVNLDVSSILNVLNKKADQSTLKNKNVQDDKDISPISNGSTIGGEEKFKADKPKVPEAGKSALLGKEDSNLHPGDSKATVFTGKAEMGAEKEVGYTSEKTDEQTGGDLGAGNSKSASTKNMTNNLADRISAAHTKIASEKKIDQPQPVSEDPDLGKISTEKNDKKVDIPEKGEGSFMGHEKEVLESVPDSKNSAPSIPVGGDNKEKNYDAEKQTHVKGTVIAGSDQKTYLERKNEATKLAGRMIESGLIGSTQLMSKIAELERYDVSQIKDLEKAMFENNSSQKVRKGLETVANGSEKTVVIAESSKFNNNPESELKNKLQSLFRLQKEVDFASSDPINELKR